MACPAPGVRPPVQCPQRDKLSRILPQLYTRVALSWGLNDPNIWPWSPPRDPDSYPGGLLSRLSVWDLYDSVLISRLAVCCSCCCFWKAWGCAQPTAARVYHGRPYCIQTVRPCHPSTTEGEGQFKHSVWSPIKGDGSSKRLMSLEPSLRSHERVDARHCERMLRVHQRSKYYSRSAFIVLLDHVLQEMMSRFSEVTKVAAMGLYLLPCKMESLAPEMEDTLLTFYGHYLPSKETFHYGVIMWKPSGGHPWPGLPASQRPSMMTKYQGPHFQTWPPCSTCFCSHLSLQHQWRWQTLPWNLSSQTGAIRWVKGG